MKAAKMSERPDFELMKQTDVQNLYYMQMPRWLFSDPRYAEMSLDAKVVYTFLLNRFQLSRRKGWINENGEVFVVFPRLALAKELRICEQRVTAAFRKLVGMKLIWEKRCGRGIANQIYLARVEPIDDPKYECAPFISKESDECGSKTSELEVLENDIDVCELQDMSFLERNIGDSRTVDIECQEPQNLRTNNKEKKKKEYFQKDVSQFEEIRNSERLTDDNDETELMDILDACELYCFSPETAAVFENAIERLYYSDSYRIGNATIPQKRVRLKLRKLDGMVLREVEGKLNANLENRVKNSTAYIMATIFNCISECDSDLMVDPYLNSLRRTNV